MDENTQVTIHNLPPYIIVHIFKFINLSDLLFSVRNTCQLWNQLSREKILWRVLDVADFHNHVFTPKSFLELLKDVHESVEFLSFDLTQHDLKIIKHEGIICSCLKEICIGYYRKVNTDCTISTIDVNNGLLRLAEKYPDLKKLHVVNQVLLFEDIFRNLEVFVYESDDKSVGRIRAKQFLQHHLSLKHITFRRCILSIATVTYILTEYSQLETLDLCGSTCVFYELNNVISLEDVKVEKLRSINFSETDVVDGLLQKIARKAADLDHLNLAKCPRITNAAVEVVAKFCTNLRTLIIDDCDVTSAGIERVAENCHNLAVLKINNCPEVGDSGVAAIIAACHQLVELEVAGCLSLQDVTVFSLVKNCSRIQKLNLGNCPQLTGKSVSCVLKHCKNLKYLNIETCHRVTDLELIENEMHDTHGENYVNSLCELNVEEIGGDLLDEKHEKVGDFTENCEGPENLGGNSVLKLEDVKMELAGEKNDEVEDVLETPETEPTTNEERKVESEEDISAGCEHSETEATTYDEQKVESVEDISAGCEHSDNELRISVEAVKPFENCSKPTETNFTHENVQSMQYMKFFENHSHVSVLNLSFCSKVTNSCIKQIAQHCPDLQELDIQACYLVTNAGVRQLVQHCKFLRTLNISGGSVSQTSRLTDDCLEDIVRYGSHLRKLMIVKNYNITADGVFKVVQNCKEIESLKVDASKRSNISKEILIELSGKVIGKTICLQFRADVEILVFKDAELKLRYGN